MTDNDEALYGRRTPGEKIYSTDERAHKRVFLGKMNGDDNSWFDEDNEGNRYVFLYEAPRDSPRGYLSIWVKVNEDYYKKIYMMSGDDGMVYEKFLNLNEQAIKRDEVVLPEEATLPEGVSSNGIEWFY